MLKPYDDTYFMKEALREAQSAYDSGEVPVGAVMTLDNRIIARAHNEVERLNDSTAHAEILVLSAASHALSTKYLSDCVLYVTLEPCLMCAGALFWSRIGHIVYGAEDEKRGFMLTGKHVLHPSTKVEFGLLQDECSSLLKAFFKARRLEV